jgi:hypothetical protein
MCGSGMLVLNPRKPMGIKADMRSDAAVYLGVGFCITLRSSRTFKPLKALNSFRTALSERASLCRLLALRRLPQVRREVERRIEDARRAQEVEALSARDAADKAAVYVLMECSTHA